MRKAKPAVDFNGKEYPSTQAMCDAYGISYKTFQSRKSKGWDLMDALTRNVKNYNGAFSSVDFNVGKKVYTGSNDEILYNCECRKCGEIFVMSLEGMKAHQGYCKGKKVASPILAAKTDVRFEKVMEAYHFNTIMWVNTLVSEDIDNYSRYPTRVIYNIIDKSERPMDKRYFYKYASIRSPLMGQVGFKESAKFVYDHFDNPEKVNLGMMYSMILGFQRTEYFDYSDKRTLELLRWAENEIIVRCFDIRDYWENEDKLINPFIIPNVNQFLNVDGKLVLRTEYDMFDLYGSMCSSAFKKNYFLKFSYNINPEKILRYKRESKKYL